MQTSDEGRRLIERFEGRRLSAYRCPAGVWTIGYGHTQGVKPHQTISGPQADKILSDDLHLFEKAVSAAIKTELRQHEFDACVSLSFNIGAHAFATSTVARRLNAEDYSGAASAFQMWTHANGKVVPGLVIRRAAEMAEFLEDPILATHLSVALDGHDMPRRIDAPAPELLAVA